MDSRYIIFILYITLCNADVSGARSCQRSCPRRLPRGQASGNNGKAGKGGIMERAKVAGPAGIVGLPAHGSQPTATASPALRPLLKAASLFAAPTTVEEAHFSGLTIGEGLGGQGPSQWRKGSSRSLTVARREAWRPKEALASLGGSEPNGGLEGGTLKGSQPIAQGRARARARPRRRSRSEAVASPTART